MTQREIAVVEAVIARHLAAAPAEAALRAAATAAIAGYGPQILGYLVRLLRDEQAAREVFSVFCEDLWKGIRSFRRECPFRVWAYKLALHAARRHATDPFLARGRRLATAELRALYASVCSMSSAYQRGVARTAIERFRGSLDLEEQTLLTLRVDKELSWREVAEVLGEGGEPLDDATVRKRFERIKERLRHMAEEEGLLA